MWILPATHTRQREEYSARICRTFGEEVLRLMRNGGNVVIPEVIIQSPTGHVETFTDVAVTAHNFRSDVLQPGTVTALDILLSLGEQGKLSRLKLTWHERIGGADPVDSYWVEQIKQTSSQNCDYHPCCISAILANPEGSCG